MVKLQSILLLMASIYVCGCVGPSSPFGGLDWGTGDGQTFARPQLINEQVGEVNFKPKRQVLHEPHDLKIVVNDHDGVKSAKDVTMKVEYNGRDVTYAFKKYLRVSNTDENQIYLVYSDLRLTPKSRHEIKFYFSGNGGSTFTEAQLLPPICDVVAKSEIRNTGPFKANEESLGIINTQSHKYDLNPNLLAGIIAQESGFNPNAKSRAGAIGLTQITTIAANEIENEIPEWKPLRNTDSKNDWRRDVAKSIEGGAVYLKYLSKYWSDESARDVLNRAQISDVAPVILASYNSGAARVKRNISEFGKDWLDQRNLKEAFRYVNSVSSYCYHFGGGQE